MFFGLDFCTLNVFCRPCLRLWKSAVTPGSSLLSPVWWILAQSWIWMHSNAIPKLRDWVWVRMDLLGKRTCMMQNSLRCSSDSSNSLPKVTTMVNDRCFRFIMIKVSRTCIWISFSLDWQNYLRSQAGNTTTVNLVICTVDYLLRLQESMMDFYWYYSRKELIDNAGKSNLLKAIGVASQVFNTLTEVIQGPCVGNQQTLAHSRYYNIVAKTNLQLDSIVPLLDCGMPSVDSCSCLRTCKKNSPNTRHKWISYKSCWTCKRIWLWCCWVCSKETSLMEQLESRCWTHSSSLLQRLR